MPVLVSVEDCGQLVSRPPGLQCSLGAHPAISWRKGPGLRQLHQARKPGAGESLRCVTGENCRPALSGSNEPLSNSSGRLPTRGLIARAWVVGRVKVEASMKDLFRLRKLL
jgi:hypothetical protein